MSNARLGTLLFIFSETIFFVFLLVSYINFHAGPAKEVMSHDLNVPRAFIYSICLLLSSVSAGVAVRRFFAGKIKAFNFWISTTVLLGSIFIVGQFLEYDRLFMKKVTVSRDPLSTAFFTVTGFHGLHVLVGLLLLALLLVWSIVQTQMGRQVPKGSVEAISLYWHFVDIVWLGVFSIVYVYGTR